MKKRKLDGSQAAGLHAGNGFSSNDDLSSLQSSILRGEFAQDFSQLPQAAETKMKAWDFDKLRTRHVDMSRPDAFELQVEQMLVETTRRTKAFLEQAKASIQRVKSVLHQLVPKPPLNGRDAEHRLWEDAQIRVPFAELRPSGEARYSFEFAAPESVLVSENAVRTALPFGESIISIEIILTMPSRLFQKKDYLDHRYFYKRAYYLACVAAGVKNILDRSTSLQFAYKDDNRLEPMLLVTFSEGGLKAEHRLQFRLLAVASDGLFSANKTMPWHNCTPACRTTERTEAAAAAATPFYNSSLRLQVSSQYFDLVLQRAYAKSPSFAGASMMIALWLRQRGLSSNISHGGFGAFESSVMLALLLSRESKQSVPAFSAAHSQCDLFKAFLRFLVTTDLINSPLHLDPEATPSREQGLLESPMFVDGLSGLNLLYKMTSWSYNKLRHEASLSTASFDQPTVDHFRNCFIAKIDNDALQYDCKFRGSIPVQLAASSDIVNPKGPTLNIYKQMYEILAQALKDRVKCIDIGLPPSKTWEVQAYAPETNQDRFVIRLVANPNTVDRAIDRGPPAENKGSADAFRRFWGQKAELRRFKDGTIAECLAWSESHSGHAIVEEIVRYAVERHLSGSIANSIKAETTSLKQIEHLSELIQAANPPKGLREAFEILKQYAERIEGLPLQLRQFALSSPQLRLASPSAENSPGSFSSAAAVIMQFESSSRWPDDLDGIQRTKSALLLKFGELLERRDPAIRTSLVLENQMQRLLNVAYLDVRLGQHSFRVRIYHDRELTLLEQQLTSPGSQRTTKEAAAEAISEYKATYINRPLHTQAIRILCTRYTLLSPTISLLKFWCARHFLMPHLEEEFIELLAASVFTQPHPYEPPGSIRVGFLRAISKLAHWSWPHEPFLVDLIEHLSWEDIETIQTQFQAWRKIDPAMNRAVFLVGSPLDKSGVAWTMKRPQRVIAARLVAVAKATVACATVLEIGASEKQIFRGSLRDYDFAIYINKTTISAVSKDSGLASTGSVPLHMQTALRRRELVDVYVAELERLYGNHIMFFHDGLEQAMILGLWNPSSGSRTWRVNLSYSTMPLEAMHGDRSSRITANKAAMLNEMAQVGGDLVSRIEILKPLVA